MAEALILGTMMVGQASAFQPNYNKAVIAAGRIFKLLDRKPLIDSDAASNASGLRLVCKVNSYMYVIIFAGNKMLETSQIISEIS